VKVLMLLDVGGTMDEHIARVEELFSAAKTEFKHLEFYYFHNCPYERVWKNNRRRLAERIETWDLLRRYNPDYKLIFVGDATMSPSPSTFQDTRGSIRSRKACGSTGSRSRWCVRSSATGCSR